jgi:hypothetical protein
MITKILLIVFGIVALLGTIDTIVGNLPAAAQFCIGCAEDEVSIGEIFTDENGNKAIIFNGIKYTIDEDGKMTGEDGSCAYLNPDIGSISACEGATALGEAPTDPDDISEAPTDPDDISEAPTDPDDISEAPTDEGMTGDQGGGDDGGGDGDDGGDGGE